MIDRNITIIFILMVLGLVSCFSNKYKEIGQKKVKGSESLQVKFFQLDVFEHISPIEFELLDDKDSVLITREYLTGETPMLDNVENFSPILHDSIFYICYPYPKVYAIHHLNSSKSGLSRDTLFKLLKANDNRLIDNKH